MQLFFTNVSSASNQEFIRFALNGNTGAIFTCLAPSRLDTATFPDAVSWQPRGTMRHLAIDRWFHWTIQVSSRPFLFLLVLLSHRCLFRFTVQLKADTVRRLIVDEENKSANFFMRPNMFPSDTGGHFHSDWSGAWEKKCWNSFVTCVFVLVASGLWCDMLRFKRV